MFIILRIAAILIFSSKPSNSISVGPNKAASPDEIRKYVESLIGNLKSRLQYLGINILCFGYMTCYMASTFQQVNNFKFIDLYIINTFFHP